MDGSMVTPSWPRIPSHGGCFPIELGGPFIEAISLAFAYTHHPTSRVDARGGAGLGLGGVGTWATLGPEDMAISMGKVMGNMRNDDQPSEFIDHMNHIPISA